MTSWRDSASQQAQDDLDELLNAGLEFAQQQLATRGEFYPYAVAIRNDGQTECIGVVPDSEDDYPISTDAFDACMEALTATRKHIRAGAIVADVRVPELGSDAIRVELEHADGHALTVLLPYTRKHLERAVDYGHLQAQAGDRRIWPLSQESPPS